MPSLFIPLDRLREIIRLALPIIGGMLSQSLINLVDSYMVGALGSTALAAAGISGYVAFVLTALILGLSSGVQATTAYHYGAQCQQSQMNTLNSGLWLALLLCIPLAVIANPFAHQILSYLNNSGAVVELATPYLNWRIWALIAVGLNLAFRGYWNGVHHSRIYFKIIVIIHLSNIALSYGLIYGKWGLPRMGVEGAGLGTFLSIALGTLFWLAYSLHQLSARLFLWRLPEYQDLKRLAALCLPNSIQQTLFAMGYLTLFWIIGLISPLSLAVGHILVNLSLLMILPAVGLGMAATSLVGRSLGQKDHQAAQRWGFDVAKTAVLLLLVIALPLALLSEQILSLFIIEPQGVSLGLMPLKLTALMMVIDASAIVLTQALLGAGASALVMQVSVSLQWGVFLPLAFIFGPYLGFGLTGIWLVQLLYRALNAVAFVWLWRVKAWRVIKT
ncbi:putative efflux protein, MATE family [Oceanospirillum multiglobuliferum]|nr:MATE family efflux transporter [Oceanospirillum multiglobuliferum]SJZ85153.1 putative efflux protein, MATE family [Oceanospirillum multiglobuliferum]